MAQSPMGFDSDRKLEQIVRDSGFATPKQIERTKKWLTQRGDRPDTDKVLGEMVTREWLARDEAHRIKAELDSWCEGKRLAACAKCGHEVHITGDAPDEMRECRLCHGELRIVEDDWIGKIIDGQYEVVRRINEGGFGQVYMARRVDTDGSGVGEHVFAVKLLKEEYRHDDKAVQSFFDEVAKLRLVKHGAVVSVVDTGVHENVPYFVMEYIDGEDLRTILTRREHGLDVLTALWIMEQVAGVIAMAHKAELIHRDIKPGNIMTLGETVDGDTQVKVLDFGIAKLKPKLYATTRSIWFTPGYQAPESSLGHISPVADVWALGVVLFECLNGFPPFDVDDPSPSMDPKPFGQKLDTTVKIAARIEALVGQCLRYDPKGRPNASTVYHELRRLHQMERDRLEDGPKVRPWLRRALRGVAMGFLVAALAWTASTPTTQDHVTRWITRWIAPPAGADDLVSDYRVASRILSSATDLSSLRTAAEKCRELVGEYPDCREARDLPQRELRRRMATNSKIFWRAIEGLKTPKGIEDARKSLGDASDERNSFDSVFGPDLMESSDTASFAKGIASKEAPFFEAVKSIAGKAAPDNAEAIWAAYLAGHPPAPYRGAAQDGKTLVRDHVDEEEFRQAYAASKAALERALEAPFGTEQWESVRKLGQKLKSEHPKRSGSGDVVDACEHMLRVTGGLSDASRGIPHTERSADVGPEGEVGSRIMEARAARKELHALLETRLGIEGEPVVALEAAVGERERAVFESLLARCKELAKSADGPAARCDLMTELMKLGPPPPHAQTVEGLLEGYQGEAIVQEITDLYDRQDLVGIGKKLRANVPEALVEKISKLLQRWVADLVAKGELSHADQIAQGVPKEGVWEPCSKQLNDIVAKAKRQKSSEFDLAYEGACRAVRGALTDPLDSGQWDDAAAKCDALKQRFPDRGGVDPPVSACDAGRGLASCIVAVRRQVEAALKLEDVSRMTKELDTAGESLDVVQSKLDPVPKDSQKGSSYAAQLASLTGFAPSDIGPFKGSVAECAPGPFLKALAASELASKPIGKWKTWHAFLGTDPWAPYETRAKAYLGEAEAALLSEVAKLAKAAEGFVRRGNLASASDSISEAEAFAKDVPEVSKQHGERIRGLRAQIEALRSSDGTFANTAQRAKETAEPRARWRIWKAYFSSRPPANYVERACNVIREDVRQLVGDQLGKCDKAIQSLTKESIPSVREGLALVSTLLNEFDREITDPSGATDPFEASSHRSRAEQIESTLLAKVQQLAEQSPDWPGRLGLWAVYLGEDPPPAPASQARATITAGLEKIVSGHCVLGGDQVKQRSWAAAHASLGQANAALASFHKRFPPASSGFGSSATDECERWIAELSDKLRPVLVVESVPAGATVEIDGRKCAGVTPLRHESVEPGATYSTGVSLAGWLSQEKPVSVKPYGETPVTFRMGRAMQPPPGLTEPFWHIPKAAKDQYGNDVVAQDDRRFDPQTGWPYEMWLKHRVERWVQSGFRLPRKVTIDLTIEFVLVPSGDLMVRTIDSRASRDRLPGGRNAVTPSRLPTFGSGTFHELDFVNCGGFCATLSAGRKRATGSQSQRIWELLPPDVQRTVEKVAESMERDPDHGGARLGDRMRIVEALDAILGHDDLFMGEVPMRPTGDAYLPMRADANGRSETEIRLRNRVLLGLSYPRLIARAEIERIADSFYMSKYEVTQTHYRAYDRFPPRDDPADPHHPANGIGWLDAQHFCEKLSEAISAKVRLPRDEEWEHACRAGTVSRYYWGDDLDQGYANVAGSSDEALPMRVGTLKPNGLGLYDMIGNVAEWTATQYGGTKDSIAPYAVLRGGTCSSSSNASLMCEARYLGLNGRAYTATGTTNRYRGFRICVTPTP